LQDNPVIATILPATFTSDAPTVVFEIAFAAAIAFAWTAYGSMESHPAHLAFILRLAGLLAG
jgi:hypothetical protein